VKNLPVNIQLSKNTKTLVLGFRSWVLESKTQHLIPITEVVGLGRVELPTSPLSGVRSSHLSYRPGKRPRSDQQLRSPMPPYNGQRLVELIGVEPTAS
jgi:hypothetical protein